MKPNEQPVLSLSDLVVEFQTPSGLVRAIDGLSLDIFPNEVLAIVGESGSGKSVTALAVMGLLPATARITSGIVEFRGREITHLSFPERAGLLGREMSIIFQDPMSSLNPVMKIGRQIAGEGNPERCLQHGEELEARDGAGQFVTQASQSPQ